MMREIEKSKCSCGGEPRYVMATGDEIRDYACSRGCCIEVFECDKCKTRFVMRLEAPEME